MNKINVISLILDKVLLAACLYYCSFFILCFKQYGFQLLLFAFPDAELLTNSACSRPYP